MRRRHRIDVATVDVTDTLRQSITTRNTHLDSLLSLQFIVVLHHRVHHFDTVFLYINIANNSSFWYYFLIFIYNLVKF